MKGVIHKDEAAVSPVIATILMVAITVVLAAVLYVMVSGLITPVGGNKPLVTFAAVTQASGNATISVAGASQSVSPSNYKVNLQVGANTGGAVAMPTTGGLFATMTINSVVYRIYWTDIGGEKTVNSGDNFRVTGHNLFEFAIAILADDAKRVLRADHEFRFNRLPNVRNAVRVRAT